LSCADFLSKAFKTFNGLPFSKIPVPEAVIAAEIAELAASTVLNFRKPVPLGRLH